jgi:GNAT superfamily N-acetyltransferase
MDVDHLRNSYPTCFIPIAGFQLWIYTLFKLSKIELLVDGIAIHKKLNFGDLYRLIKRRDPMEQVSYRMNLDGVDWEEMKAILLQDDFDNGRTPEQLKESFENSYAACIAYAGERIIGTARVLSDGVCNAYVVDVWTLSAYRHQGIASEMMRLLLERLPGQHVYLFTDDAAGFYRQLSFKERGLGMELVVGTWLRRE